MFTLCVAILWPGHSRDSSIPHSEVKARNWSADWGNGVVLPKLLPEDQDRRRGLSFGKIPLRRFVFEIQF